MRDERDEIRARVDIVDLVGQKVLLKRAGKHWKGLCPFHDDRNPSFLVSADTGRYKCWSCGESGDAFTWVMKTQNVEFPEALKLLAELAGIELKGYSAGNESSRKQRLAIMELAQARFVEELSKHAAALEYCENRGLDAETRAAWGLGFAPESDHMLAMTLRKAKAPLSEAKELFLVDEDGAGGYFDKFRGRLMFPIRDERGELIAYGGRALGDGLPKYINSGDTPLFRKSKTLYGMDRAKATIGKTRKAILVEGYLDVIACHRAGLTNAVASLGTSLAEDHAKLLKRWCDEAVVLYDADAAGEKAAQRAAELLNAEGVSVRIALMPKGQDPDSLLRAAGAAAVQRAAEGGLSPVEFRLVQIEKSADTSSDEFWTQVVDALSAATSFSEVERLATQCAGKYLGGRRVGLESLLQRVRAAQRERLRARQRGTAAPQPSLERTRLAPAEIVILRAFLESDLRREALLAIRNDLLFSPGGVELGSAIRTAFPTDPPQGKPIEWLTQLEDESARQSLADALIDVWERLGMKLNRAIAAE